MVESHSGIDRLPATTATVQPRRPIVIAQAPGVLDCKVLNNFGKEWTISFSFRSEG